MKIKMFVLLLMSVLSFSFLGYRTAPNMIEYVGEKLGYDYCVSCNNNCFTRGEVLVSYKEIDNIPWADYRFEQFVLCKICYSNPKKIDLVRVVANLLNHNSDKHDSYKIIQSLLLLRKNSNNLLI